VPGSFDTRVCHSSRRACTTAASAAVALLFLALLPAMAWATGNKGVAAGVEAVKGGSWGAVPSPSSMSWDGSSGLRQTATVANTGTIALTSLEYTVAVVGGNGSNKFTLAACATPWTTRNTCAGGAGTAIGKNFKGNSTTVVNSTFVPGVGGEIYLQALETGRSATVITMTLTVAVTAVTETRAPFTTNQ
jgi:hypothetical protein